jgi:hypothetical protein
MKLYVRILTRRSAGAQRPCFKRETPAADYPAAGGFLRVRMDFSL